LIDALFPNVTRNSSQGEDGLICIQSVPDKFFFLLFSLIRQQLRHHLDLRVELVAVRAISGAVGVNWLASFKRWPLLTWWWLSQWERAWGDSKNGIAYRSAVWFRVLDDIKDKQRAQIFWDSLKKQKDYFSLVVDGIEVGDLVIDSYLRFRPSPRFDVNDPFVKYIIWQALRDMSQAKIYFSKVRPRFYLSSYSSYIEHGVTARVALKYGVRVFTFGDLARFGKQLTVPDPYHTINYSRFREDFELLDRREERLEEARAQLEVRLNGGIDVGTSYMKQSAYGGDRVVSPQSVDGAIVVFLHDFYDSYNAYPGLIFCDFWRWICFTIEVLQAANIKFFLKPHPNQINLSDAVMVNLRERYPEAQWLPSGICNADLVDAGMLCGVTAYGTVAHELAYLGIPTIGYGQHPHHSFDFCRTAKSQEEYKSMLESPAILPLDKVEMQHQALAFYYMRNMFGSPEDTALREAFIHLWRTCNIVNGGDEEVLEALQQLGDQPAFRKFINDLAIVK
jgi:hypothetical protein